MRIRPERFYLRAAVLPWIAALAMAITAPVTASAETTIAVTHPATEPPTFIDNGTPGESAGDVRIFQFDAKTEDGDVVRTDWIMTTTGVDTPQANVDSRVTLGVFSFDSDLKDQIMLQGVAFYPGEGATLEISSSSIRAIIGGTGRFAGATGFVESMHLEDGSWRHVFHIE